MLHRRAPLGLFTLTLSTLLAIAACGGDDEGSGGSSTGTQTGAGASGGGGGTTTSTGGGGTGGSSTGTAAGGAGGMAAFEASVPNHSEGDTWAAIHECPMCNNGGTQTSPQLDWTPGPAGTMSYAVVMRDLDFMNGFIHWAIWDIPASESGLAEGIPEGFMPGVPAPAGSKQAPFNNQLEGYLGMCSCMSVNTYEFTVYAMPDATLGGLDAASTKEEAAAAIEAVALASAAISGES